MSHVVIDTNVLLVANGSHEGAAAECVLHCVNELQKIRTQCVVVLDDGWKILHEYQHKTHSNQPKGVGDVFLKWLLQNKHNRQRVELVAITETCQDTFAEFPVPELQSRFDPADRKFAAVANAHPAKPPVLQAADCKWLDWWPDLHASGIEVNFLCRDDVCHFYKKKFPKKSLPKLPDE